jgi:aerobic-type carbon monoxide dehydrogenase small subunit (CoxS/CutS family)
MIEMNLKVNGERRHWRVAPGETLLEALRRHHFKGPKLVCGTGDCCACTVMLGNKSVCSCCLPALKADGHEVLTVEGLAEGEELHPLQAAFADAAAAQCGFCTPGFLMRSYAFLTERDPSTLPTELEVRKALAGNICRCTGYVKPVEAVIAAAKVLQEKKEKKDE